MTFPKQHILPLKQNATNRPCDAPLSREFKYAAKNLIDKLKTNDVKTFLIDKFALGAEPNIASDIDLITGFEISRKSRLGAFYTPEYRVKQIISHIEIQAGYKYLDPGVGTGNFILPLIHKIIRAFPDLSLTEILDSVWGFDIDFEAIELCKIRLILELENLFQVDISTYININLYVSDFTVKAPQGMDFLNDFNVIYRDYENVVQIKKYMKFDYIFGNPPFVSFYGRRSKKLPELHRQYYLENYEFLPQSVKNGKLNLYMFFIEHALNLLKACGHLIYLLDNSIYETSAYHLRSWLVKNFQIMSINMGLADFDNVASGQTIWHITKILPKHPAFIEDILKGESQTVNQKIWLKNPECKIEFLSNNSILTKLSNYKKLIDYFPGKSIRTCCMLLDLTENFLVDKTAYDRDTSGLIMPYLEGSKSLSNPDEPFKYTRYIKYDYELQLRLSDEIRIQLEKEGIKNKKRIGLGQLDIYQSPKIFIRQSSERLIAKFTTEKFMANNSLYVITPIYSFFLKEDWENILIYTERLLCSKLYLYLAYQMKVIRKNLNQHPQIKVSDLKLLPFLIEQKSELFYRIVNQNPPDRDIIDRWIYQIFALNDEEINEIEYFSRSV